MKNLVCAISKLPIFEGEEMVCIPLVDRLATLGVDIPKSVPNNVTVIEFGEFYRFLGFPIKGRAGDYGFDVVYEDANTDALANTYGGSIYDFVDVLLGKKSGAHEYFKSSSVIFIRRNVYEYLAKMETVGYWGNTAEDLFDAYIVDYLKWKDELKEVVKRGDQMELTLFALSPISVVSPSAMQKWDYFHWMENVLTDFSGVYLVNYFGEHMRELSVEMFNFMINCEKVGYYLYDSVNVSDDVRVTKAINGAVLEELDRKEEMYKNYE